MSVKPPEEVNGMVGGGVDEPEQIPLRSSVKGPQSTRPVSENVQLFGSEPGHSHGPDCVACCQRQGQIDARER